MNATTIGKRTLLLATLLAALCLPGVASAQLTFNGMVVFGTSLSDPGNAYALLSRPVAGLSYACNVTQNTPPYQALLDAAFIPCAPYTIGGHYFSNGAVWAEQFALARGLAANAGPAFQSSAVGARNYAVGGARATDLPDRVNLPQQVQKFLSDVNQAAPPDALYVVEIGGNDVRDALAKYFEVYLATHDLAQAGRAAGAIISGALQGIAANMQTLYQLGARKFLVWNAARVDLVPAVRALGKDAMSVAHNLTQAFNQGLADDVLSPGALGGLPDIRIVQLDIASAMEAIINQPANYGLTNVTAPCVTPGVAPFTCQVQNSYFFWDGIHPTTMVHAIIAQLAAQALASASP